jgi:hypothetical protein
MMKSIDNQPFKYVVNGHVFEGSLSQAGRLSRAYQERAKDDDRD